MGKIEFFGTAQNRMNSVSSVRLEWLTRDNLSNPPFALVTYMKCFYKIRSEIQGKMKSIFLTKNPNLKNKSFVLGDGGAGRSGEYVNYFDKLAKNPNLKKEIVWVGQEWGGGG